MTTDESNTNAELSRLRKRRSANRNVVRKWIVKIKELTSQGDDERTAKLVKAQLRMIVEKEKEIRVTDKDIQDRIDEGMIAEDIEEASEFDEGIQLDKIILRVFWRSTKMVDIHATRR